MRDTTTPSTARQGPLTISLHTLLFVTFVAACLSRWLAHFGVGLAVLLAWCSALGGGVGAAIGLTFATIAWFRGSSELACRTDTNAVVVCTILGAFTGVAFGATGFAITSVLLGGIDLVAIRGIWIHATIDPGRGPRFLRDVSGETGTTALTAACMGAIANSFACIFCRLRENSLRYAALVSMVTALVVGMLPLCAVVVWLVFFPPSPPPPGMFHENMLGLLPLAIPIWCAIAASIGLVVGIAVAAIWVWTLNAHSNRTSWVVLWLFVVISVIVVTEATLSSLLK